MLLTPNSALHPTCYLDSRIFCTATLVIFIPMLCTPNSSINHFGTGEVNAEEWVDWSIPSVLNEWSDWLWSRWTLKRSTTR